MEEAVGKESEVYTIVLGQNEFGKPVFSVLIKRTYDIRGGESAFRTEKTNPLVMVDEYYDNGDPTWSTVRCETDLLPYKTATDVVVIGKAYAPGGKPVAQMDVSVEIAEFKKVIRVIGDRRCEYRKGKSPLFTDPVEFMDMEIRYEKAYGGKDEKSDPEMPFFYPRNHMGTGFAIRNVPEVVDGLALPNLEDPEDLITPDGVVLEEMTRWNQQPLPQGFGWYQRTWYPRCSFVGSVPGFIDLDEPMREESLGLVPKGQVKLARQFRLPSFDVKFNNGASPGLVLPFLSGDEWIKLSHLTKEGQLEFSLPKDSPRIMLDIGLGENELEPFLHTVCIRPEEMQIDLVWRGAYEYPGIEWLPEMKQMRAEVS